MKLPASLSLSLSLGGLPRKHEHPRPNMSVVQDGRRKPTNLLNLKEYIDFGLQVSSFCFIRADYFFVFESCCTHGDDTSFDALRRLNNSRTGR